MQELYELNAFALVIESSLAIAQEWPGPLFPYCMQLIKRITSAHISAKLRAAFVGYGTIDTVPSPILCKRFFSENTMVFKEIYEHPMQFGIGTTNSGGARGMAALDALVAALEMFDDLAKLQNTKICASYIIHIAASPPDNSLRPQWNDSESMDDMSWESLPVEFKKRNITYNLLTLRPPQGRLAELYASMNGTDASQPWFELRSPFVLSAASIISIQPAKGTNKRQNEAPAATEQPPENKRPRLQSVPQDSPKPIPRHPPALTPEPPLPAQPPEPEPPQSQPQQSHQPQPQPQPPPQPPPQLQPQPQPQPQSIQTQPAAPPVTQPATQPPSQIPNVPAQQMPFPTNFTPQELSHRFSIATEMMRKHEAAIKAAVAAGDKERAEAMRAEFEKKKPQYERMALFVQQYKQMLATKQNSAQATKDVGATQFPLAISNNMPGNNPPQSTVKLEMQPQPTQMSEMHPSTSNNSAMANVLSNSNVQMQTMMEQKTLHQLSGNLQPVGGLGSQNPQNPNPIAAPFTGGESVAGMRGMSAGPHPMAAVAEWTGALKFSGQGPNGMSEMQCVVTLTSAFTTDNAHTTSWPKTMELIPAEKFPGIQLQEWIKKKQACLCSFKPLPTEGDQASYLMLMQLLASTHAVALWTVPSGTHPTRNAIFFTQHVRNTTVIAGAFFPLTGVPDMLPKAIPQQMGAVPPSGPSFPPGIPQNMIQALKAMSPAERQQIMGQWLMRQNIMRQRQQQAQAAQLANQQGVGISSFNPNMQANMAPGMMGAGQPQGNFMANWNSQTQTQGGLPGSMGGGSLGGAMSMNPGAPSGTNINYETLMQRNGMNMGQNMG